MSKTSRRKGQTPVPSSDQFAAVRRVADAGDLPKARQRLAALRKSFPAFKPLLGLAWEVEDRCGEPMLASARAYEWQRAAPNSRAAVEALCESARAAGLAAVYARAVQRLRALDGQSALPPINFIDAPLGALSLEQAEAIDLSRMHLADSDPLAAAAVLKDVDHPSARNNLALALFVTGDLAQARAIVEANWQAEPANLFALERALRWRCWAEGLDGCLGFAATLQHATPRRAEDAIARVAALRFLDDAKGARLAWEDTANAPYWDHATDDQRTMFDALGESAAELPGESALWFPESWVRTMAALAREGRGALEAHQPWDARLDACDAHADYLTRAAELGDAVARLLALAVLKRRTRLADGAARASLEMLLKRPCGPDSVRMDILNWLVEQGLRNRDEPAEVWLTGSLRTIRSYGLNITSEPRPSPFPPLGTALNERVHKAIGRGELHEALALAQQLRQMHPDQPSALTNLAAIKEGLDHPAADIVELYRQAHALAPDYLFARCGLASCLAGEGRIEEARRLLDGLLEREEWHRSEYRSYLLAQRALALASGEHETVRALEASILDLEQSFAN
jgi:Flp pilus assembly protein TadD